MSSTRSLPLVVGLGFVLLAGCATVEPSAPTAPTAGVTGSSAAPVGTDPGTDPVEPTTDPTEPAEPEVPDLDGVWLGDDFSCSGPVYYFDDAANEMELEDGEGWAWVFFAEGSDCGLAQFEVEIDEEDEDEVTFAMDCDELVSAYGDSCIGNDFEMVCERRGDELDCRGDGVWSSYAFHWDCAEGACEG
jgi:hypothetical protein